MCCVNINFVHINFINFTLINLFIHARMLFSASLWNALGDPVFDCVGLAGFKRMANAIFIGLSCSVSF